ncbi:glycosyltransferase [Profundibacter sp.]
MKIMLLTIGTRGDVQPYVALGQELRARGHDVVITTSKNSTDMIKAAGLRANPLNADTEQLMKGPEAKAAVSSVTGRIKAVRWTENVMRKQFEDMWRIGLAEKPDLILHSAKGLLAPYLARKLGGKAVPVFLQPGFAPTKDNPSFMVTTRDLGEWGNLISHETMLGALWIGNRFVQWNWERETGIDLGPSLNVLGGWGAGGLRIHAYSPHISPLPKDYPKTERMSGYLFRHPERWDPPADLAAFLKAGPPPVYVGFGSMPGIDPVRQTQTVLEALKRNGQRGVIATGWGGLSDVEAGNDIHVLKAAPHSWLFPRMAAVVHHGGSGTTHEGLRWGRPTVICPFVMDQPYWGKAVSELGVGAAPIRQENLTVKNLSDAINFALGPGVIMRAGKLGDVLQKEDGAAAIADIIEAL